MASGYIILPITEPLLNASGLVVQGAMLSIYENGMSSGTLATLYSDAALTTPITNPLTSDAAGRFYDQATTIWASDAMAYGMVVALPDGSTLTYEDRYILTAATDISGLAPIDSPNFTGVPTAPTPALNDSSGKLATTAYVQGQGYAGLASPAFTGTPTAPTASPGTNTTQLATTAFVTAAVTSGATAGYYQSNTITVTPGSNGSVSHGLGVNPKRVQAVMVCTNAINGIAVGSEIPVWMNHDTGGDHGPMLVVVNDSTTIKYQFPNSTVLVLNTSGVSFNATSSNFGMVIRAWEN